MHADFRGHFIHAQGQEAVIAFKKGMLLPDDHAGHLVDGLLPQLGRLYQLGRGHEHFPGIGQLIAG
ncbi:hypothetical protein SDC9_146416 [bioreactor metagenome]|uniref:Uncharacterized protein n=1 Tax=bioreactor metagenome TaxID=1076179 RepID=A0A645ECL0_9ZZZZ